MTTILGTTHKGSFEMSIDFISNEESLLSVRSKLNALITASADTGHEGFAGYIDVGDVRVQWGRTVNADSTTVHILNWPFADSNFAITLTPVHDPDGTPDTGLASEVGMDVWVTSQSTSTFSFNRDDDIDGMRFSFIAIGRRP